MWRSNAVTLEHRLQHPGYTSSKVLHHKLQTFEARVSPFWITIRAILKNKFGHSGIKIPWFWKTNTIFLEHKHHIFGTRTPLFWSANQRILDPELGTSSLVRASVTEALFVQMLRRGDRCHLAVMIQFENEKNITFLALTICGTGYTHTRAHTLNTQRMCTVKYPNHCHCSDREVGRTR